MRNTKTEYWAKLNVERDVFACNILKIKKAPIRSFACVCMLLFRPLVDTWEIKFI